MSDTKDLLAPPDPETRLRRKLTRFIDAMSLAVSMRQCIECLPHEGDHRALLALSDKLVAECADRVIRSTEELKMKLDPCLIEPP